MKRLLSLVMVCVMLIASIPAGSISFAETSTLMTITEAKAAALDTDVSVKGIVSYVSGKNVYIQNESDAIALRLTADAENLAIGDEIIAKGQRGYYGGVIQISDVNESDIEKLASGKAVPSTGTVTIAQILETPEGKTPGYNHMCEIITLTGIQVTGDKSLEQDGASISTYPGIDLEGAGLVIGDYVDVQVRVNAYKEAVQVEVLTINKGQAPGDSMAITDAKAADLDAEVTVKGIVSYVSGKNVYIQDSQAAIALRLFADAENLAVGDEIIAKGTRGYYGGVIQISADEADIEKLASGKEVPSTGTVTIAQILETPEGKTPGYNHMCEIITLTGIQVTGDKSLEQDGTSISTYPGIDLEGAGLAIGDYVDVQVRVNAYKEAVQVEVLTINKGQAPAGSMAVADAKAAELDAEVTLKGIVSYVSGKNVYVQDNQAAIALRLSANAENLAVGDEIIAKGTRGYYGGVMQISADEADIEKLSSGNDLPDLGKVSIEEILATPEGKTVGYTHMAEVLDLTGIKIVDKYTLSQDGVEIGTYPSIDLEAEGLAEGDFINIRVRVNAYKEKVQVEILSLEKGEDPNKPISLKEALALESGTENVTVEAQIVYFATNYGNPVLQAEVEGKVYGLYVYGAAPEGAKVGDTVRMKGTFKIYNGLPELVSVVYSEIISSGDNMEPQVMTIEEIKETGLENLGLFVKIKDVTLGDYNGSGSTTMTDATGTISIYKATSYPVLVEAGDLVDLYAMISAYKTSVQLVVGNKADNGYNIYEVVNDTKAPLMTLNDTYADAKTGMDYTVSVNVQDNLAVEKVEVSYTIGETSVEAKAMTYDAEKAAYIFTVPAAEVVGTASDITFTFKASDAAGLETTDSVTVAIDNKPQITEVLPARNANLANNNTPTISASLHNAGTEPVVTLSLKLDDQVIIQDKVMTAKEANKIYEMTTDELADGTYTASITVKRSDDLVNTTTWKFVIGSQQYKHFYGQLHSHTAEYSDGSGTLADGLNYIKNLPVDENIDFLSFTDHSNYFDSKDASNPKESLNDKTKMTPASLLKWNTYNAVMDAFNQENAGERVALSGFEMTWSGGPGHINTFNSPGLVSRNNSELNNKSADAGLKAYYEILAANTDPLANLSQFNHPGKTFGTFSDFAYWTPIYDNKMVAVEVGNGEGAIDSGGYFSSYAEYTKALDKGWHVAPTNNQDNHKGKWGNANTARTVIITDNLSKEGLLTGLKNMSVYATEDKNLEIQYTVNDQMIGSIIGEVPSQDLKFNVSINDPDADDLISKVEIISNGGRVVASESFESASVDWAFELPSLQGYYYVRVTQADKHMAVTAPIWIGQAPLVGISSFETQTKLPVTDEAMDFTTTLFNNEEKPVTLKTVTYSLNGEVIKTETLDQALEATSTAKLSYSHTASESGDIELTVTVVVDVDGQEKSFEQKVKMYVRDAKSLVYVGIDASHYNEYVNGNYKDSMGNFANMAVKSDVRVVELKTSEELIAATQNDQFKMLIFTPPTRRNGNAFLLDYKNYSDEEIAAIKAFAEKGNTVIVTGWGDYYESYTEFSDGTKHDLPKDMQMSAQQNKLLEALGSQVRVSDDEIKDDEINGGQPQRLYFTKYNLENEFVNRVNPEEQVYSNYGGATIYTVDGDGQPSTLIPSTVSPMVYSFTSSYSADDDKDGTTGIDGVMVPKYNDKYMISASEKVTYDNGNVATIIVAGAAFMSNFEIQAVLDSYATPDYSNFTILDAIVKSINVVEITDIADVHKAEEGERFTVEGIVTSNASGFDKDTAFFDSIYIQDSTAGINLFPVSGVIQAGQTVRVKGITSSYNGERQLNVTSIEIIDPKVQALPTPLDLTSAQAATGANLGSLVKVSGTITKIEEVNNVVESIFVKDASGEEARVFIDGYITTDSKIKDLAVGNTLTAVGLSSISTEGPRIRVRDRGDVICSPEADTFDYVVVAGDVLWKIAQTYKMTIDQIVDMNGIENPDLIYVDQILKLIKE